MTKRKLTPWFDGERKPSIVGWYQRLQRGEKLYWYWDGIEWLVGGFPRPHTKYIRYIQHCRSFSQNYQWRGLAEKPA